MADKILMPRLSDTMTEGVIASWHKQIGDKITKGDLLAEIETDKATMELESYQNGYLLHIGAPNGGKLQVNDLLCIIGNLNEDIQSLLNNTSNTPTTPPMVESVSNNQTDTSKLTTNTSFEEVVLMPRLSDTMTEGVIASWHKQVGDEVNKGDLLADIETDKATMELESYKSGYLLYQGATAGSKIQVNDLLCIIGSKDFNIEPILKNKSNLTNQNNTSNIAENSDLSNPKSNPNIPEKIENKNNTGRIFASPLVKKIASDLNISLQSIQGSGENGRIIKQDINRYLENIEKQPKSSSEPAVSVTSTINGGEQNKALFTDKPVSQMRKTIAQRLSQSKFTAPHFYLTMKINMDEAIKVRTILNEQSNSKISFNDIVVKAVAFSLKKHPIINSSWMGDFIRQNNQINIGIAVAVDEGLLVPVLRNADTLTLSEINISVKEFAAKAKDKKLQPKDWEGSTFTISNLGMFGIEQFTAIINTPDSCILAVGGIMQEPIVKNNQIVIGNTMQVTLSCDHRVVDGASGAAFLQTLKKVLEEPIRML